MEFYANTLVAVRSQAVSLTDQAINRGLAIDTRHMPWKWNTDKSMKYMRVLLIATSAND